MRFEVESFMHKKCNDDVMTWNLINQIKWSDHLIKKIFFRKKSSSTHSRFAISSIQFSISIYHYRFSYLSFNTFRSRYTKIEEFNNKSWIRIENESFRMFNASFNWRMTFSFRTSLIALRIAINRCMIVDDETFISIMQKYASKTSNVNIKSSKFIESFNVLKIICKIEFESISNNFATMIAYTRRKNSWYRFIISIEWWISTKTTLTLMFIFAAYCLNFRAINCLLAFNVIRSNDSKYVLIQ
jgi:hypothetical protein